VFNGIHLHAAMALNRFLHQQYDFDEGRSYFHATFLIPWICKSEKQSGTSIIVEPFFEMVKTVINFIYTHYKLGLVCYFFEALFCLIAQN
jgi:hypothetical protein